MLCVLDLSGTLQCFAYSLAYCREGNAGRCLAPMECHWRACCQLWLTTSASAPGFQSPASYVFFFLSENPRDLDCSYFLALLLPRTGCLSKILSSHLLLSLLTPQVSTQALYWRILPLIPSCLGTTYNKGLGLGWYSRNWAKDHTLNSTGLEH